MPGLLKDPFNANLFELTGDSIKVVYSSGDIRGPSLSYRVDQLERIFRGEELQFEDSGALGQLITVIIRQAPDLEVVTFTLVLPIVGVPEPNTPRDVKVPGITVTNPTTIAGPGPGAQKLYSLVLLKGTAQFIVT
jgi:hypothetical protein